MVCFILTFCNGLFVKKKNPIPTNTWCPVSKGLTNSKKMRKGNASKSGNERNSLVAKISKTDCNGQKTITLIGRCKGGSIPESS